MHYMYTIQSKNVVPRVQSTTGTEYHGYRVPRVQSTQTVA